MRRNPNRKLADYLPELGIEIHHVGLIFDVPRVVSEHVFYREGVIDK